MPDSALRPERWEQFDDFERQTIQGALASVADSLVEQHRRGELDEDAAQGAAITVLIAGRLMYSISDHEGEQRPSLSTLEAVASAVAKGGAPA